MKKAVLPSASLCLCLLGACSDSAAGSPQAPDAGTAGALQADGATATPGAGTGGTGGGPQADGSTPSTVGPDAAASDAQQTDSSTDAAPPTGSDSWWTPAPGTTWQWQLTGAVDTGVDVTMYDIDLFDAPGALIEKLHADGRVVICYFSAGSREDWRDDEADFAPDDYGKQLDDWPGENWLDVRSDNVRAIMQARLDLAVKRGCDGVEPDNVDGHANDTGFDLSRADQLDYNGWLAEQAHTRGLSVGLKNALELIPQLVDDFDWALNEECLDYNECTDIEPFIEAGKAVFHVEYVNRQDQAAAKLMTVCAEASRTSFSTLVKTWDVGAEFHPCP